MRTDSNEQLQKNRSWQNDSPPESLCVYDSQADRVRELKSAVVLMNRL